MILCMWFMPIWYIEKHICNDERHRTTMEAGDWHDHAKIYTPQKALSAGSTYLVIGRPITEAKEPMKVIQKIISLI